MGKVRRILPVLVFILLLQRAGMAEQPIHWDASIDSAKAAAARSHRLVLVFFSASWCSACHGLEDDLRNQPGAVATLEANFVPVKVSYDYFPNTAKQYGVTRLPTTVILVPNAAGDVLAVLPERMPVDEYLAKLNKVAADGKKREAGVYAQIQASPSIGSPAGQGVGLGPVAANSTPATPVATAKPVDPFRPPVGIAQNNPATAPALPTMSPALSSTPPVGQNPVARPNNTPPAGSMVGAAPPVNSNAAVVGSARLPEGRPPEEVKPVAKPVVQPAPTLGLDGYCPVQLVEKSRWQKGQKAWGAIHRGRIYLFVGIEERRRFMAAPDRYAPVNSGDDVVLAVEQGRSVPGFREHGVQFENHIYLFADEASLGKFRSNPHYYADRALQAIRPVSETAALR
jgi:thioredoxin-related protein